MISQDGEPSSANKAPRKRPTAAKASAKAKSKSKAKSKPRKTKTVKPKQVRKASLKAKAKAKSGGRSKRKGEKDAAPTDVGPYGFDDQEQGEEEPEEVDQTLADESLEVTRKRKEPIAPPATELAPAPAKKVAKPEAKESQITEEPVQPNQKIAEGLAAPSATAPMQIATAASIAPAPSVELDTQDGTQWFLGTNMIIFFASHFHLALQQQV